MNSFFVTREWRIEYPDADCRVICNTRSRWAPIYDRSSQNMSGQQSSPKATAGLCRFDQRWRTAAVCLLLVAMTFAIFGQTWRHEFVDYDDNEYVFDNPVVAQGLTFKGFVWAFTHVHS